MSNRLPLTIGLSVASILLAACGTTAPPSAAGLTPTPSPSASNPAIVAVEADLRLETDVGILHLPHVYLPGTHGCLNPEARVWLTQRMVQGVSGSGPGPTDAPTPSGGTAAALNDENLLPVAAEMVAAGSRFTTTALTEGPRRLPLALQHPPQACS